MIESSDNDFHKADFLPQLRALTRYLPALESPDFHAGEGRGFSRRREGAREAAPPAPSSRSTTPSLLSEGAREGLTHHPPKATKVVTLMMSRYIPCLQRKFCAFVPIPSGMSVVSARPDL
ncbi:hypothetical protein HYPDE_26123 [Hyphomicrobium denitrificans 1NES1]|uniref:Uncharacterized protein n=1 Tax=Hyphomicrobium denitrificans 1NES1 TaxID=670307 RepID=N0B3Y6_9HYPH|nr:hypothetical protein [Hyphomicrobium denitrificans]AGK56907.1 hypothetical protein HYPDE_26123 [Hyphomicrobium denitrificans 1NES1]